MLFGLYFVSGRRVPVFIKFKSEPGSTRKLALVFRKFEFRIFTTGESLESLPARKILWCSPGTCLSSDALKSEDLRSRPDPESVLSLNPLLVQANST